MTRRQQVILGTTIISSGLMFSTLTSVAVALPSIQREFGVPRSAVNWVIAGALLPMASLLAIGGRIGDLFGRRRMFIVGLVCFGLASALCGLAPTEDLLIAGRVAQGIGVSLSAPLALANVTEAFPEERRGWAIGLMSTGITVATLSAPLGMAVVVQLWNWRWLFLPNAVICAMLALVVWRYLGETDRRQPQKIDVRGIVLMSLGLTSVALGCEQAGYWGLVDWRSIGLLVTGLGLLSLFVVVESRTADPLLNLDLLRLGPVSGSVISLAVMQWASLGIDVYLMLYLQQVLELAPLAAGLLLLPTGLGPPLFSSLAGWLTDRGLALWLITGGLLLAAVTLVWIAFGTGRQQSYLLIPALFLSSVATAFVYTPSSTVAMTSTPKAVEGVTAGLTLEARQFGSVIGLTAVSAVLLTVESNTRRRLLLGPDQDFDAEQRRALDELLADADSGWQRLGALPPAERPRVVEAAEQAYVAGLQAGMLTTAGLLVLTAFAAGLLLRSVRKLQSARR
jgi:EmrB/QacA subfamily drug resistance transporter